MSEGIHMVTVPPTQKPAPAATGSEPCYACDGTGQFSDVALAFDGAVIHGSCGVCRGTGSVACICSPYAQSHYLTCPSRQPLASMAQRQARIDANNAALALAECKRYEGSATHATNGNYNG